MKINETIISLLLKLHSQLSGTPDSYNPDESATVDESSESLIIGDGPFFIGRLLQKISALNASCLECVIETRNKLWPRQHDECEEKKRRENREREERRRRAKERQQKLMAEFATKQKQFMEKAMEEEEEAAAMDWNNDDEVLVSKQEYHCVICNQSSVSSEDKPMGLVALVQATSVIGHRRRQGHEERAVLPTNDEENYAQRKDDTLASEFDRRVEELDRHFDPVSVFIF